MTRASFHLIKLCMLLPLMALAACSRTVQWEEEVPLNTGETIVVKRSGTYRYQGLTSDGSHFRYVPEWRSTIEFTYMGKQYSHTDDAGLVLLAISPDGLPNLVANAVEFDWHSKNRYYCVIPYYVQFRPDSAGKKWIWPERIDPWLYGLPTNLVFGLPPLEVSGKKFTAADRQHQNASSLIGGTHYRQIISTFDHQRCLRKN